MRTFCSAVIAWALGASTVLGAAITPGNLVIYRVGDGGAALGTTAASVFLDEYTTGGGLVQSIPMPASSFSATGNSTTEGIISPTQDGTKLVFTGYNKAAGGTSPASDTYLVTPRVISALDLTGTTTTYSVPNDNGATTANTIRSATSVDGTSAFWTSTSSRIGYVATPGVSGTTQIDARNSRQVNLFGNELFASNGSTTVTGKVQSYGSLPTGATAATPIVTLASTDAVNGFVLLDLSPSEPGVDTIYALSTVVSQLLKWTKSGGAWSQTSSIGSVSAQNLTSVESGGNVTLYLTSGTTLSTITDTSGYGGSFSGSLTTLASAGTNTAFRGIGVLVPEPATAAFLALGAVMLRRRRRA